MWVARPRSLLKRKLTNRAEWSNERSTTATLRRPSKPSHKLGNNLQEDRDGFIVSSDIGFDSGKKTGVRFLDGRQIKMFTLVLRFLESLKCQDHWSVKNLELSGSSECKGWVGGSKHKLDDTSPRFLARSERDVSRSILLKPRPNYCLMVNSFIFRWKQISPFI